jgi:undecaprenyl-diphosphatase
VLSYLNLYLFQLINMGAGSYPLKDGTAIFFAEAVPYLLMLIFIIAWFSARDNKKSILIEATEASLVGLLLNQMVGLLYFHPRPFMVGLCSPLIPHAPETSFPSDHGTLLFAGSTYFIVSNRCLFRGLLLFFVAFMTAWSRVYCGIHFPFDMLGSLAVGILSAFLILKLKSHLSPLNERVVYIYEKSSQYIRGRVGRGER